MRYIYVSIFLGGGGGEMGRSFLSSRSDGNELCTRYFFPIGKLSNRFFRNGIKNLFETNLEGSECRYLLSTFLL